LIQLIAINTWGYPSYTSNYKKNEADQQGLIHGSWWQPLYFSETELADYEVITNNLVTDPVA